MSKIFYIEDIFIDFVQRVQMGGFDVQFQDISPINSFYDKVSSGQQLTSNQGSYLLKILDKYKKLSALAGFDYEDTLSNSHWKLPFRTLDLSKRIYIEKNEKGKLEICLKFPYQLKTEFEKEIDVNLPGSGRVSHWDSENKVRRLSFYDFNLINLFEFASRHNFEIDESFMCAMADVEEIWQHEEDIKPYYNIVNNYIELSNENHSVTEFFDSNSTGDINSDLFLLKSMGLMYVGKGQSTVERIASSPNNTFWIKNNHQFLDLYKSVGGKVVIILDRTAKLLNWIQDFVRDAEQFGIPREEIKVCFRDSKDSDTGLNEWVKLAGVGGKVENGSIFIFEHRPAKWLFKENLDVKIVVTNNLYPHTNQITKDWLDSHPCVVYLGDIKPSEQKGKNIVEL